MPQAIRVEETLDVGHRFTEVLCAVSKFFGLEKVVYHRRFLSDFTQLPVPVELLPPSSQTQAVELSKRRNWRHN